MVPVTGERAQKSRGVSPLAVSDGEISPLGRTASVEMTGPPSPGRKRPCPYGPVLGRKSLPHPVGAPRLLSAEADGPRRLLTVPQTYGAS